MTEKPGMNEKDSKKSYDLMQDTGYLLLGLEESEQESYELKDIMAEFGGEGKVPEPVETEEPEVQAEAAEEPATPPEEENPHPKIIAFPGGVPVEAPGEDATMVLIDMREYEEAGEEDFSPQGLFGTAGEQEEEPPAPPEPAEEEPKEPKLPTMEDIVASTVDAVKAENEEYLDKQRRRIEKERKKEARKQQKPRAAAPVPEEVCEQPPKEAAAFHKRRYTAYRKSLTLAVPILLLMWLPWFLQEAGVSVPYFGEGLKAAAVCTLVAQGILCAVSAPLIYAAVEEVKFRSCTCYTYAVLVNLAALLDEIAVLVLPERGGFLPLGAVAGCAAVFSLWGLKNYHRGMWETYRTAAMGEPSCVVDCGSSGVAKGLGRCEGFSTRADLESTASRWQRLLVPVLTAATLVFALMSSVGQGRGQDFFWCWAVMLCASCSLVGPLSYCVPFGRIVRRLSRNGTAVAGQYGAAVLASSPKLVVTDTDLFPRNCVALCGIRLYGEERNRAISYAATLAVQGGGCMARVFEQTCQNEHIAYQPLEHFHIHDDNGLSGMIRGETVLVGTPVFMRHKAVRLPAAMPAKTAVCLAVDGELVAVFAVKYDVNPQVETSLRSFKRNRLQMVLATRDGNVGPKLIKKLFGTDGKAACPEISERLALSDPQREGGAPNGMIYRDGLLPYVELVSLSRRLCQTARVGNLLSIPGSVFGALLSFYLVFAGSTDVLTPIRLVTFLLLWVIPMIPLLLAVDQV